MSRLIIKNLPSGIKEERLRKHFEGVGHITDCNLKFTKSGQFRKFAFIGYKTQKEAQAALKQFNKTFIDASKIQIEIARDFGDVNKPRAWSKYSKESSVRQKLDGTESSKSDLTKEEKKQKKKEKEQNKEAIVNELLGELKDDPNFNEFLEVHQNVGVKPVWTNDNVKLAEQGDNPSKKQRNKSDLPSDDDDSDSSSGESAEDGNDDKDMEVDSGEDLPAEDAIKAAKKKDLSDLDYLRSKVGDQQLSGDSDTSDSESSSEDEKKEVEKPKKKLDKQIKKEPEKKITEKKEGEGSMYVLKLKGLPANVVEKSVREFFQPLDIETLKLPKNAKKKPLGIAYVGFKNEKDLDQALGRNKNFIGGKRIFLKKSGCEAAEALLEDKPRPWELKQHDNTEITEGIAETGRLFVRNLSYACTEDDLEAEFKKYGPLTEVNLPIDSLTKKVKGFAFITYMIPENAVKAFIELDGKVFQGRMLHILPGKEKQENIEESREGSSFKKQKQAKQKALAGSSHNWNSLFLGANAVADVLAERYKTSKSDILDSDLKGSLGVRMALGETQIVAETRDFLTENGVSLDSFSQANAARSKTVILVKNLPASTNSSDIEAVFSKHGTLGRVLLPPSGITAVVEFVAPTEARAAFTKLAYTKFQHVPLYLEWAPMEVFTDPPADVQPGDKVTGKPENTEKTTNTPKESKTEKKEDSSDDEEDNSGSVLFVKNLNFDTIDDSLKQVFKSCGKVKSAIVARKKDIKNPGSTLSMGYGFVEFKSPDGAQKALKELQHTELDGHTLELKISNRTSVSDSKQQQSRKKQKEKKQKTSKILVRNIPFEAKRKEVEELFKVFGELKTVRLPKKMSGTGSHRGFGFVDFLTRHDAKRAFESLCHSTHLYGRRLVLEWADAAEDIDDIRKRTADHFHEDGGKKKFTKAGLKESLDASTDR